MAISTAAQPTTIQQDYTTALNRWLQQQQTSRQQYQSAADPLQQSVQAFQPGGSYGAGQIATLEDESRRAQAAATSQQVASGMSSGSLATSTGLRISSDLAKAKLGVDDTRTQFLAQAQGALSGLRGQQAGQTAATVDPFFSTFQSAKVAAQGQELSFASAAANRSAQRSQLDAAKKQADREYDLRVKQLETASTPSTRTTTTGGSGLQY